VSVGFAVSLSFLMRNLYPILANTDMRTSKILLVVFGVLHAGLAIAIKILFFAHGSPAVKLPDNNDALVPSPTATSIATPPADAGSRFLFR